MWLPSAKGAKECQRPAGASPDGRWNRSLGRAHRPQGGRSQKEDKVQGKQLEQSEQGFHLTL